MLQVSKYSSSFFICFIILFISVATSYLYTICYNSDLSYHFNRLHCLVEALRDHSFPNYMNYYVVNGYGYLVNFFYSDFLFLPFALIGLLTNSVVGYECLIFTTTFTSALFSYIVFFKIFKNKFGGIIFSILYTTASYRIFDLYFRGAMGEVIAISILPIVLWGAYEIIYGDSKKWYVLAIGFSLLIYSHAISTFIVFLILILVFIICISRFIKQRSRFYNLCLAVVTTILLSAYFLVPYIEMNIFDRYFYNTKYPFPFLFTYEPNFVIEGLFTMIRGRDPFFPKIGMLVFFVAFFMRMFVTRSGNVTIKRLDVLLLLSLLLISCNMLIFPWRDYPFTKLLFVQMGSRFIPMATILLTFCSGYYLSIIVVRKIVKLQIVLFLTLMGTLVLYGDAYSYNTLICNNQTQNIGPVSQRNGIMFAEFLPEGFPENPTDFANNRGRYTIANQLESTSISNVQKSRGEMSFDISTEDKDILELPLTYYKGYDIKLNNNTLDYTKSDNGLIKIIVNSSGTITTEFVGSTWVTVSFYFSMLCYVLLFIYIFRNRKGNSLAKITN